MLLSHGHTITLSYSFNLWCVPGQLFFLILKRRAVLGVVDLFALPCLAFLPHYQVVETCSEGYGYRTLFVGLYLSVTQRNTGSFCVTRTSKLK